MQCLNCGGQLEWAGGGKYARCMRDLSLFSQENGQLTPVVVEAPGGGFNPEFNNMFAQNLGFGPPPPGAQPMPPAGGYGGPQPGGYGGPQPGGYGGPQPPQHDYGKGQFDLGGGQQLRVKINGQSPENYVKNQVSSMVWGWIIGAAIVGLLLIGGVVLGIYIYLHANDTGPTSSSGGVPTKTAQTAQWDGKTPFTCGGNDAVALTGVNATAGVTADGNCQLTLTNVTITAPVAIKAGGNAKVNVVGGTVNGATDANMNAVVTYTGTKVTGAKTKKMNAKINGP